jgi:hypothetical protein
MCSSSTSALLRRPGGDRAARCPHRQPAAQGGLPAHHRLQAKRPSPPAAPRPQSPPPPSLTSARPPRPARGPPGTHADSVGRVGRAIGFLTTVGGLLVFGLTLGVISDFLSLEVRARRTFPVNYYYYHRCCSRMRIFIFGLTLRVISNFLSLEVRASARCARCTHSRRCGPARPRVWCTRAHLRHRARAARGRG